MKYWEVAVVLIGLSVLQVQIAFSFISKGTVESVIPSHGQALRPIHRTAKISRLFTPKQKTNSTLWQPKNDTDNPELSTIEKPKPQALVQDLIDSPSENAIDKVIYNRSSNSLISSKAWKDLNTALSEEDMKRFLTTLPLHTLRSLTSLTKKSPELGQKQLMRLILDRSHRIKIKATEPPLQNEENNLIADDPLDLPTENGKFSFPNEIEESGSVPTYFDMENLSKKLDELGKLVTTPPSTNDPFNEAENTLSPQTSTTPLPVINPPYNILRRPTTSMSKSNTPKSTSVSEVERQHRVLPLPPSVPMRETSPERDVKVIMMGSPDAKDEGPRQMNSFNFNSGYYIPPLTSTERTPENPGASSSDHLEIQSSPYHPQDPENTYHPNGDNFLMPPLPTEADPNNPSSSSVWMPSKNPEKPGPSTKEGVQRIPTYRHPFSGFDSIIKLQPAESQDDNEYFHQSSQPQHPQYKPRPVEEDDTAYTNRPRKPSPNSDYNYIHSTVHTDQPQHTYKVISSEPQEHFNSNQNIPPTVYHNTPSVQSVKNENYKPQVQHHHYTHDQSYPQVQSEVKKPQFSSTFSDDGFGHDHYNHHEEGAWDKVKSYFSKGKRSTAEKVFEVSIAILSFLAFGGYLLMLIYQVLAVSSTVPLFPILSSAVPQNPTLIGLLLGRGMNSESAFNFDFPGEKVAEKYINQLEVVVKRAMSKVKESLEGVSEGTSSRLKGDLGH